MSATDQLEAALAEREQEAERVRADTERARVLSAELEDLHHDLARIEKQRDNCASLGKQPLEIPWTAAIPGLGEVPMQPHQTAQTGAELAAGFAAEANYLAHEIEKREHELAALLQ